MITIYTILIFIAIILQAFFTASEMAFTTVNRIKLKNLVDAGNKNASNLDKFLRTEGMYLGTTLVGTNISVVISSVLATRILTVYFGSKWAPLLTTLIMVPVTLIFAEIIPKMISRQFSTEFALKSIKTMNRFYKLFQPVIQTVNFIATIILSPFGKRKAPWDVDITKNDLKKILLLGHETGEVETDELELIHKVLDFGAKKVEKIMVPMYRVSSISHNDTAENLRRLVTHTGFSRIPVYKENKNDISGIVNIYDVLFDTVAHKKEPLVSDYLRVPVYINRNDGLDIALTRLRFNKQPMGIIADDDNKVAGIITIEDILEEIVGEIEDTGCKL